IFSSTINGSISGNAGTVTNGVYTSTFGSLFDTRFAATTTTALAEGNNLYFTSPRATANFIANLAATTSVASITTLPSLSITNSQVSDFATGVNTYINGSTTIAKTYTANAFNASQAFNGGLTVGTLNGPLQANNGVVSATTSVGVNYGGTGLTSAPGYGQLLMGNSSGGYTLTATSSLGINSAVWGSITGTLSSQTDLQNALNAKLNLTNWYSTTTDQLTEGSTNLYFTAPRATANFIANLAATSSVASITTLPSLALSATQITGFGIPFYQFFSATTTDALAQGATNRYYSDTFVNAYINASTTIAKTYTANTFTNTNTFNGQTNLTYASTTAISGTTSQFATASSTNLFVSGTPSTLLKTLSTGQVAAAVAGVDYLVSTFAYPFINNATTTLLAFNGGFTATNATTTNLFAGRVTANTLAVGGTA
ncbi:MAG: hypothetical protein ABL856_03070, partial [Gallionella sp.]